MWRQEDRYRYSYGGNVQELGGGLTKKETDMVPHKQLITQSSNNTTTTINRGSAAKQYSAGVSKNAAVKRVEVAPPIQKITTEDMKGLKKRCSVDFESSKRKFEERFAEQKEAKRRIIMVDFHDMPKPAKDPAAPRRCWNRTRL